MPKRGGPRGRDQDHDGLVKETFSNVRNAVVELRAILPPQVLERMDLSTLEVCSGTFVDKALRHLYTDLLYRVQLAGRSAYIFLIFEHQSTVDRFMMVRLLGAVHRLLQQLIRDGAQLPLPVVLPILLHHSETGWTAATNLHALFEPEQLGIEGVAELVPEFRVVLDDISHKRDEELMSRALDQAEQVVPIVLWALRDARKAERILGSLSAWAGAIEQVLSAPSGRDALLSVFSYISKVTDFLSPDDIVAAAEEAAPQAKEVIMTLAEQWMKQGEAEGEAKGEAKGKVEGKVEVLRKLLALKFGPLPDAVEARLEQAGEEELGRWVEQILSATSIDEVFA